MNMKGNGRNFCNFLYILKFFGILLWIFEFYGFLFVFFHTTDWSLGWELWFISIKMHTHVLIEKSNHFQKLLRWFTLETRLKGCDFSRHLKTFFNKYILFLSHIHDSNQQHYYLQIALNEVYNTNKTSKYKTETIIKPLFWSTRTPFVIIRNVLHSVSQTWLYWLHFCLVICCRLFVIADYSIFHNIHYCQLVIIFFFTSTPHPSFPLYASNSKCSCNFVHSCQLILFFLPQFGHFPPQFSGF